MTVTQRTPAGETLTDLILTLFRVSNLAHALGDRMSAPLGLTSARWQVLGAIDYAKRPQPVAWLARDLGANRQNIQRIVNDLVRDGVLALEPNPHHKRAQLVVMTEKGRQAYQSALAAYDPVVNILAEELSPDDLKVAQGVLSALRTKLEEQ